VRALFSHHAEKAVTSTVEATHLPVARCLTDNAERETIVLSRTFETVTAR